MADEESLNPPPQKLAYSRMGHFVWEGTTEADWDRMSYPLQMLHQAYTLKMKGFWKAEKEGRDDDANLKKAQGEALFEQIEKGRHDEGIPPVDQATKDALERWGRPHNRSWEINESGN